MLSGMPNRLHGCDAHPPKSSESLAGVAQLFHSHRGFMTLLEILTGSLTYDSSWAVYAEKIDGKFSPDSPARFGQRCFENGGLLDSSEMFGANDRLVDSLYNWMEGDPDYAEEAAIQLIHEINEAA